MHGSICESQLRSFNKSFTSFLQVSCLNNIINQLNFTCFLWLMMIACSLHEHGSDKAAGKD